MMRRLASIAASLITAAAVMSPTAAPADATNVLVFSKTTGFRHDSIPIGIQTIRELGAANGFTVTATEDANVFTTANLAQYQAVVFLNTTGDPLNNTQQTAFESYINGGGGYLGVHAAADTEYNWPFYGQLVGAYFASHPAGTPRSTVRTEDTSHPATAHFGPTWVRNDELYNYRTNPRANVRVLQNLDESTYSGGTMGADHPITWCHTQGSGRSFYTGLGHTQASYTEAPYRAMLLGAIRYVTGLVTANCTPGQPPTSTTAEGEAFTSQSGVQIANHAGASGGRTAGFINNGDWTGYSQVSTTGARSFSARTSSAGAGGRIEVRSGSATGTLLGSVAVPVTGSWDTFTTVSTTLTGTATGPVFLRFTGGAGSLFDVDTFTITRS